MLSSRPIPTNLEQLDVARGHFPATKTPGRAFKGRTENTIHQGAYTVQGKGKRAVMHTPFHRDQSKPDKLSKPGDASQKASTTLRVRPLADKTPFPNRQNATPLPYSTQFSKLPALSFQPLDEQLHQTPQLPPSSTRKKLRVPRSASRSFETPITKGDHWNVSDVSIEVGGSSLGEVCEEGEETETADYSEPEYMPPTAIIPPYEPPFEMPDYREVGAKLLSLSRSYHVYDDSPPQEYVVDPDQIMKDGGWTSKTGLPMLPPLEDDDPLCIAKTSKPSLTRAKGAPGGLSTAAIRPVTRPGMLPPTQTWERPSKELATHPTARSGPRTQAPNGSLRQGLVSRPRSVMQTSRAPTASSTAIPGCALDKAQRTSAMSRTPKVLVSVARTLTPTTRPSTRNGRPGDGTKTTRLGSNAVKNNGNDDLLLSFDKNDLTLDVTDFRFEL